MHKLAFLQFPKVAFMNFKDQVCLITTKIKGGKEVYEVEKQGVRFLRRFKSKKFRVVLNVSHCRRSNSHFNSAFLSRDQTQTKQQVQSESQLKIDDKSQLLTICTNCNPLSDDRIIVVFNAYLNGYEKNHSCLVVFGYLAASAVFYQNLGEPLSENCHLTHMLSDLGQLLSRTDIDKLNEDVKYRTGFQKNPYFLFINTQEEESFHSQESVRSYFNEFYRYREEDQKTLKVNQALETIIDYFPERSALSFCGKGSEGQLPIEYRSEDLQRIRELGHQFETEIVGRQLFNFEFTGSSLENLSFQMCESFNRGDKINLVETYNKIILNQKACLLDEALIFYTARISQELFHSKKIDFEDTASSSQAFLNRDQGSVKEAPNSIFPISQLQLERIMAQIKFETVHQSQKLALNCMTMEEYIEMEKGLTLKVKKYESKVRDLNQEKGLNFVNECYEMLQNIETNVELTFNDGEPNSEEVSYCLQTIKNKIELFSDECVALFTEGDCNSKVYNSTLLRLIQNYLDRFSQMIESHYYAIEMQMRSDRLQLETLKYELKRAKSDKRKLENEYELQDLMMQQYKDKLSQAMASSDSFHSETSRKSFQNVDLTEFYVMKKKIDELEEEVKDKNLNIEELNEILDKFQGKGLFQKQEFKFGQEMNLLISRVGEKINQFYDLLEEIKNVDRTYEKIKQQLAFEREKIIEERVKDQKEMNLKLSQFEKVAREKELLEEVISEDKSAIEVQRELQNQLKSSIDQLQHMNGEINCLRAETENELQLYRKATKLVVEQHCKGKSDSLSKFFKFLEDEDLKQLLKPMIKK